MDTRQLAYLNAMGVTAWKLRDAHAMHSEYAAQPNATPDLNPNLPAAQLEPAFPISDDVNSGNWQQLRASVTQCRACELHAMRTQTVFGVGNQNATWMIIGEAPGADEDRQGEPFVGRAGQLLNQMLLAIGLKREEVFIANILKCRPPNNRDPRPEEVIQCESFLKRQVELVNPKIILAVGRIAAHNLLKVDTPLSRMRGKTFHYSEKNTPVVITYHPAYLLRSPKEKRKAWQDLLYAKTLVNNF